MTTINLGLFSEISTSKADVDLRNVDLTKTDILIEYMEPTEAPNYNWYRLYASGFVEQGGRVANGSSDYTATVTFPIRMADTSYTLVGGELTHSAANTYHNHAAVGYDKTTTTFKTDMATSGWKDWYCCGKADMAGHEILPNSAASQTATIQAYEHRIVDFGKPTAENNYTWFRKYADGWVEQGGFYTASSSAGTYYVTLPITMSDLNYAITGMYNQPYTGDWTANTSFAPNTTSQIKVSQRTTVSGRMTWRVEGLYA